jgi:hypothetical protein
MDVHVDQKWWKFVGSTINMAEDEIKLPLSLSFTTRAPATHYT